FLVNALSQAKLEKLLDEDTLASAEADVMISGPALCLYFAALRSTSNPPSVPIPGTSRSAAPLILSTETCPPIFQPLFRLWSQSVPAIQGLSSSDRHDLARIICDREPLSGTQNTALNRIAADLRSVAIEITQRRTFQERYQSDLQQALDAGVPAGPSGEKRRIAAFMPPPSYDDASSEGGHSRTHSASYSQNGHSGNPSPTSSAHSSPHRAPVPMPATPSRLNEPLPPTPHNPAAEGMASIESRIIPPQSPSHLTVGGVTSSTAAATAASTSGGRASSSSSRSRSASPTLLPPDSPAINLIRETLYAALGEVIASTPSIKPLMQSDPARAYYASVALSILTVSTDCITVDGGVITPLGRVLTIKECLEGYRPLMAELGRISRQAKEIETEDNDRTIAAVRAGQVAPEPRLERVRRMLEYGVAKEEARYDAHEPTPPPPAPSSQPVMRNAPQPGNAIGLQSPPPVLPPRRTPPPPMPIPIVPSAPLATAAEESQRRSVEQEPATTHAAGNTPSSTSPPRSSSEQPRGRHLLHKLRPGSAGGSNGNKTATTPPTTSSGLPPIAPKPSNSPSRYPAPTSPPPSRPPISSTSEESPQGPGMAGIGARPGLGVGGLIPTGVTSGGGGGGFATSTGGSASPPKAAMMLHQGSLNAAGGPYGTALGSGARIPGTDTGITLPTTRPEAQHPAQAAASTSTAAPVANDNPAATSDNPRRSLEGTAVQFANRINGLALQLTRLRMFQERQDMVFKILASVHD
ncbi:hypothetical protein FRC17_002399, partial [Serendipita sp. 399]